MHKQPLRKIVHEAQATNLCTIYHYHIYEYSSGMGNLYAITGCMDCGLSLAGRKI